MNNQNSSSLKHIVILVENHMQWVHFLPFAKSLKKMDITAHYVTGKFSIYIEGRSFHKININLISKQNKIDDIPVLEDTFERANNYITSEQSELWYGAVYGTVCKKCENLERLALFVWTDQTIAAHAMRNIAKKYDMSILYFDNGNIQGKLFVDPCGVNVNSLLYRNINLLDNQNKSDQLLNNSVPKHSSELFKIKRLNYLFLIDLIFALLLGIPFIGETNIVKKIYRKTFPLYKRYSNFNNYSVNKYYFIPLPHSYELKNIKMDIDVFYSRIRSIIKEAIENGIVTIIKFHPREENKQFINLIVKLKEEMNVLISHQNTDLLIRNAEKIFLSNSSIAIDVFLQKKQNEFLSPSFYDRFNFQKMLSYITYYLITPEYESKTSYSERMTKKVLHRLDRQ